MKKKILIVDDDKILLNILTRKVSSLSGDIEIIIAMSYKEGIRKVSKHKGSIHAAIIDLNLPDAKNGEMADYTLAKDIPTVILTGIYDVELKERLLKNNILDYIQKNGQKGINSAINSIDRVLKNYETNVLVVDDSDLQRNILKEILTNIKLNVITAKNGEEALSILKDDENKFSLVLTDYNMPKMDGMELIMEIRELYDKDQLGVIALSSNETSDVPTKFIKIGANDYINKPYSQIEVATRVNSVLHLVDLFDEVRMMSYIDYLTNLYNRRYFFSSAESIFDKLKRENKDLALVMLDIDNFKSINDTYGHSIGDLVIVKVAEILKKNLRKSDLLARFGGEEFSLLLENISFEDTYKLLENIRIAIDKYVLKIENIEVKFTISIGFKYGMMKTLDDMINAADKELYKSKETGKNKISYSK